jgi:hypothetical protein
MGGEVDLPGPTAGEGDQSLPGAGEREMENDTDDTIVVVLDLSEKPFPCIENERLGGLDDRWPFVANVAWCGVFEGRLLDGRGAEKLAETVETDLLGDIELQKDVNGARESKGLGYGLDLIQHPVKDSPAHGRGEGSGEDRIRQAF